MSVQRVLVVSSMYPSADHPIQGIFVHEQVKALRSLGLDVRVVTGRPVWLWARHPFRAIVRHLRSTRERWPGWGTHDGVDVARFPYPAGAFSRVWLYPYFYAAALRRWLPAIAKEFPFDVVHTHTAFLDGRAGTAAARFRDVPHVLTEHTGPLSTVTAHPRMRRHVQAGVDGADMLIAVSRALAEDMCTQLHIAQPERRLLVVPNGVDTGSFDPGCIDRATPSAESDYAMRVLAILAARCESMDAGLTGKSLAALLREVFEQAREPNASQDDAEGTWNAPDAVHALWVGHHVEVKRVDRLIEAFADAYRDEPRLRLTLLGDGPLLPEMQQRVHALRVEAVVRFLPSATRTGVRAAMDAAQFLALPSQSETFGVVLIEALAMGRPVLATRCGGPEDIVDDPALGILVDNNTAAIADGLRAMARGIDSFDRALIRQRTIERFEFAQIAGRLLALYTSLAARTKVSPS